MSIDRTTKKWSCPRKLQVRWLKDATSRNGLGAFYSHALLDSHGPKLTLIAPFSSGNIFQQWRLSNIPLHCKFYQLSPFQQSFLKTPSEFQRALSMSQSSSQPNAIKPARSALWYCTQSGSIMCLWCNQLESKLCCIPFFYLQHSVHVKRVAWKNHEH